MDNVFLANCWIVQMKAHRLLEGVLKYLAVDVTEISVKALIIAMSIAMNFLLAKHRDVHVTTIGA
jgi:hypothetical protein